MTYVYDLFNNYFFSIIIAVLNANAEKIFFKLYPGFSCFCFACAELLLWKYLWFRKMYWALMAQKGRVSKRPYFSYRGRLAKTGRIILLL